MSHARGSSNGGTGVRTALPAVAAVCALTLAGAVRARAQIAVQGGGVASMAEHRVDAGSGVEQASGMLVGAEGRIFIGSRVELFVHGAAGKLTADSAAADDRDVAEAEVRASVVTVPWLALHAAVSSRAYSTTLTRQRWTALRFGGEARLAFVGGGIVGTLRGEILPSVSVSGLDKPNRAFAAAAGLEWRVSALALGLRYELERYDVPAVAGAARREQLSQLVANVGLVLGRQARISQ